MKLSSVKQRKGRKMLCLVFILSHNTLVSHLRLPHVFCLHFCSVQFSSVQLLSHVWLFATPWTTACQASLSFTISWSLLKSCPSCHPTISSSAIPFSSCPPSFPASGSFPVSHLFASDGQSIGASASALVLPMNIQNWLPLGLTGLISFQLMELSKVFFSTMVWKHQFFGAQPFLWFNFHLATGKTIALTLWTFVCKVMSLLFNILSRFVIAFLPRSKCLLISWQQSPSMVILEPKKIKCHCFHFFPIWPWIIL